MDEELDALGRRERRRWKNLENTIKELWMTEDQYGKNLGFPRTIKIDLPTDLIKETCRYLSRRFALGEIRRCPVCAISDWNGMECKRCNGYGFVFTDSR